MNQKEWKSSPMYNGKYFWHNKARKLQRSLQYNSNPKAVVIHHLRDTEEQRKYNDTYYERWGFNEDGTFEYGKYIIFVTEDEHSAIHNESEGTRAKIGEASRKNWQNEEYRNKIISANKGKKLSESEKQFLREIHLGPNNHMYGKSHSDSTKNKMRESHLKFWQNNEFLREEYKEKLSGENNAMYGRSGKAHPKYGVKLSDETRQKISKNNGIKKIHTLYMQYKANGGIIGWHEFQKLPNEQRLILANNINADS